MNKEFINAINDLVKEKGISKEIADRSDRIGTRFRI